MRPAPLALIVLCTACGAPGVDAESSGGPAPTASATETATAAPTTGDSTGTTASPTTGAPTTSGTTDPSAGQTTLEASTGGIKLDLGAQPDAGGSGDPDESTCEKAAMSLTSAGCRFAPTVGGVDNALPWAVVAANTSTGEDAKVGLYAATGELIEEATVAAGQLHTFILTPGSPALEQHAMVSLTGVTTQAMRLESDLPVVAYQFTPYSSSQVATADASLLLPEHAWGEDYLVPSYHNSDSSDSWVSVVSLVDGNEVTIEMPLTMVGATRPGGPVPALAAGGSHTVTIGAQQVLRVVSPGSGSADLTGMRVRSSGPVAVMTGSPEMSLPGPGFNAFKDYLEEQVPPRTAWGTDYAVVKFRPRSDEGDLYRFIADKGGTVLTLSGDVTDEVVLDEGEFHQLITDKSFHAVGSEAFMVAHYMLSSDQSSGPKDDAEYPGAFISKNCQAPDRGTTELGDPAISFIVPTDQFRSSYTFLTPETYAWDMLTVVAPIAGWASIVLDGAALPEPTALGFDDLGYARLLIPDGPHDIRSPTVRFGIEVYGYDCRISYAYPGGLRLGQINTPPG